MSGPETPGGRIPDRQCDTYTVWSPTGQTVTARCLCGWAAEPRFQVDVAGAAADEMDHLWWYVTAAAGCER